MVFTGLYWVELGFTGFEWFLIFCYLNQARFQLKPTSPKKVMEFLFSFRFFIHFFSTRRVESDVIRSPVELE